MKFCIRCHEVKPLADFVFINKARGERQSWCRPCDAAYKREWYAKNRERHIANVKISSQRTVLENRGRVSSYLAAHPCVDCGETDPVVLEFDHLRDKVQTISYMVQNKWCWATIQAEIEKCAVRCANCHRRKTAIERGYYDKKRGIQEELAVYA